MTSPSPAAPPSPCALCEGCPTDAPCPAGLPYKTRQAPAPRPYPAPSLADALAPILGQLPDDATMDMVDDDERSGLHRTASVRLTFAEIRALRGALSAESECERLRREVAEMFLRGKDDLATIRALRRWAKMETSR